MKRVQCKSEKRAFLTFLPILFCGLVATYSASSFAEVHRELFIHDNTYIKVEVLTDQLFHVEMGSGAAPEIQQPIPTSVMIDNTDYAGPDILSLFAGEIETAYANLAYQPSNGCLQFKNLSDASWLAEICGYALDENYKGLRIKSPDIQNVYGLGQRFQTVGSADGDRLQQVVLSTAGEYGHHVAGTHGDTQPQLQFPVAYFLGDNNQNYALVLDSVYKQVWDFGGSIWDVNTHGDKLRFYLIAGEDLLDLRRQFMDLTGRPPVPPKKAFGFWLSEFGYKNWEQIDGKIAGLRAANIPVDGVVLDLFWFGGVQSDSPHSSMGSLDWDELNFPDPAANIARLSDDHIGVMAIEESYVATHQPNFSELAGRSGLAHDCLTEQAIDFSGWMGEVGMIDWSNIDAAAWWHDALRLPNLIDLGIIGHWTDLGEPERYDPSACYAGVSQNQEQHADVHNIYNLLWSKSIYDGYVRNADSSLQRPFILSRAGTIGSQRYGTALWSGDIDSRLDKLSTHFNQQIHMSFSGIDYYGTDVGGFWRDEVWLDTAVAEGGDISEGEMYTRWLANSAWFDIPLRPHTYNCGFDWIPKNCPYETSPAAIGDISSNRANIQQRYALLPYYYSAAYQAFLNGDPVIAPPVIYHQNDPELRQMGHQKYVGRDLLVGISTQYGEQTRQMYLPAGSWANFHTGEWIDSAGEWTDDINLWINGDFRLPVFARAGAIIPLMPVDAQTKDSFGHRSDGQVDNSLMLKVFADAEASEFILYEDDGSTVAGWDAAGKPLYAVRQTQIQQIQNPESVDVTINAAEGSYVGAVLSRNNMLHLSVQGQQANAVMLNNSPLQHFSDSTAFNDAASGWVNAEGGIIKINTGVLGVVETKEISVSLEPTCNWPSLYLRGSFNGWGAQAMACSGPGVWRAEVSFNQSNNYFKFDKFANWLDNYGDDEPDGIGDPFGKNIAVAGQGSYVITLSEASLQYEITGSGLVAPTADAGEDIHVKAGESFRFDASESIDPDGEIVSYAWSTGLQGVAQEHSYSEPGQYVVILTVTDNDGLSAQDEVLVTVVKDGFLSNFDALYLRGTFNQWAAEPMALVANYEWEATVSFASISGAFKFDRFANWQQNYGDNNQDQIADISGKNIPIGSGAGTYRIGFNELTLQYRVQLESAQDLPPVVVFAQDELVVFVGESFTIDASQSYDSDGQIVSWLWNGMQGNALFEDLQEAVGVYEYELQITDNDGLTRSKTARVNVENRPVNVEVNFKCLNGQTYWGQSVYVVGNHPLIGSWNAANAVKLSPANYPVWSGDIDGFPVSTKLQWKCIKKDGNKVVWQSGANNFVDLNEAKKFFVTGSF